MTPGIAHDIIYPRTPAERLRLYERHSDGTLRVLATCATGDAVLVAIRQLREDATAAGTSWLDGTFGLYDAIDHDWIIPPFPKGAS